MKVKSLSRVQLSDPMDCSLPGSESNHMLDILSPSLFNIYTEYIMRNVGLDDSKVGIKIARRNIKWHPTPVLLPGKSMDGGAW